MITDKKFKLFQTLFPAVAEVLEQDGVKGLPIYLYGNEQSSESDKNEHLPGQYPTFVLPCMCVFLFIQ